MPKRHVPSIYTLDDDLGAAIMREAIRVAKAVKIGLRCDGTYLTQANGAAAGQDVFHLHLHVYPRWYGHSLNLSIGEAPPDQHTKQTIQAKIVQCLHDL